MAIHFFLGFIGCLLACSIALAVVVKNLAEGIAVSGKKPFLYGSGSGILTSLAAYLASFMSANPFEVFWFFGGIFFLFGIIHMLFIHKRFFYAHKHNSNEVLIAEVLFGLSLILFTIVIFSALQYFFKDPDFLFYPIVVSAILFFVPLLIFHSFQTAYDIPAASFLTWQYPLDRSLQLPDIARSDAEFVIAFEVAEKEMDGKKGLRVYAYESWQLGTLFHHFINEYENPLTKAKIEYIDKEDEPYKWWFYKKTKWYQVRRILNPEFTIREGGIRENTVIVCERLLNNAPVLKTYNKQYYER